MYPPLSSAFSAPASTDVASAAAPGLGVEQVVATGKPLVSDLVRGGGFKPGLIFVSVPIMVDGKVAFVSSGGVRPQRLQGILAEARACVAAGRQPSSIAMASSWHAASGRRFMLAPSPARACSKRRQAVNRPACSTPCPATGST